MLQEKEKDKENVMSQPVSIVLPVWNNINYLPDLFSTLKEKTKTEYELIVIDQGSTDGSQQYVLDHFPDCIKIQNVKNNGSTGAWNQGIRKSKHELVLLLNSDIKVLVDNWLEKFQKPLELGMDKVGIVECLETIWNGETRWAGAACPLINKAMCREIGLFDEKNLWGFCGDTDYWIRAAWNKWEIGFYGEEILIYHDCGGTHRRGELKESAEKDWKEGNRILREKWTAKAIHDGWDGPRLTSEVWLKIEREAGRLA